MRCQDEYLISRLLVFRIPCLTQPYPFRLHSLSLPVLPHFGDGKYACLVVNIHISTNCWQLFEVMILGKVGNKCPMEIAGRVHCGHRSWPYWPLCFTRKFIIWINSGMTTAMATATPEYLNDDLMAVVTAWLHVGMSVCAFASQPVSNVWGMFIGIDGNLTSFW